MAKLTYDQKCAIQAVNAAIKAASELKRAIRRADYSRDKGIGRWEQDVLTHIAVMRDCIFGED